MSSENRNKVLLGFGALVVVLIIAIALWPPNFRKEDASGAIGAVQKHHAPQITQKDVILGDETVRHQQKVLYADFLADASKLKVISNELLQAAAASRSSVGIAPELNALSSALRVRYAAEFAAALADAEIASRPAAARVNAQTEIQEMQSILRSRPALSDTDMKELTARLSHFAEEANARTMSRVLYDADREMTAVAAALASSKLDSQYQDAARRLEAVETELNARNPLSHISLQDEVAYLAAVEMQSRIANEVAQDLAARQIADQEMAGSLAALANQLEVRAVKAIESIFELQSQMATRLQDMDDQVARASSAIASRAGIEAGSVELLTRNLRAVSQTLNRCESEFQAGAMAGTRAEILAVRSLENTSQLQHSLADFETQLQANRRQ